MQNVQNPRVSQLVQAAHEAARAGRLEEAMAVWEQVRALAPAHPQALFHLGRYALVRKNPARARDLFQQAANADPDSPALPLNLSYAYRDLGDGPREMDAIVRALTIDPYYFPALLAKGMLLERSGHVRKASQVYKNLLAIAPPEGEIPPEFQEPLRHAREIVRENTLGLEQLLKSRLDEIRHRHANENLDRFDEGMDIALGKKKAFAQQPSMLLFPRLPAVQFYDDAQFPWLKDLEAATDAIREELVAVMQDDAEGFQPYVSHPDGSPLNQWKELNKSPRWSTYFLWKDGVRMDEACARCPRTAAVSEAIPVLDDTPNFGPTIMFSVLAPRTHIPPHSSVTNARLVTHLPVIVPQGCRFRVGNETRDWREGNAWVFDDTFDHEAWNDSDEFRVILMIDIWNPNLTLAERELVSTLLNGMRDYFDATTSKATDF
jgi:aspartyl/asparaginyl beta-hydroxylase (cupin superfamily)